MNVLSVLYGGFGSNSANPLALYARELGKLGHDCAITVPWGKDEVRLYQNAGFHASLYTEALANPSGLFPNGRPADVIHACTPRETVREFVTAYQSNIPTPLAMVLEDNEPWIAARALSLDDRELWLHTSGEISSRLPKTLAHPFRWREFIGLADAAAVVQDKLAAHVPPWVPCKTVHIGVDLDFYSPRPAAGGLREKYGIEKDDKVIVYPGGMNNYTREAIRSLCEAVGLINAHGIPCTLLRSGANRLDFLDSLPAATTQHIKEAGVLPQQDLPGLMSLADVFVQPGRLDPFEDLRLPGKLPEYFAMGRPVVLPDVNISYLLQDGVNACLMKTGEPAEIADICMALFRDPERTEAVGNAGRKIAEQYFNSALQAGVLEQVYQTAIERFRTGMAAKVWQNAVHEPAAGLLARKLKILADDPGASLDLTPSDGIKALADWLDHTCSRISGLESLLDGKDGNTSTLTGRELRAQLDAVMNSTSWRLTSPFRYLGDLVKKRRLN